MAEPRQRFGACRRHTAQRPPSEQATCPACHCHPTPHADPLHCLATPGFKLDSNLAYRPPACEFPKGRHRPALMSSPDFKLFCDRKILEAFPEKAARWPTAHCLSPHLPSAQECSEPHLLGGSVCDPSSQLFLDWLLHPPAARDVVGDTSAPRWGWWPTNHTAHATSSASATWGGHWPGTPHRPSGASKDQKFPATFSPSNGILNECILK